MNKRTEKEFGDPVAGKREWHWALRVTVEAWGEKELELRKIK
jgi:hypothetical protein